MQIAQLLTVSREQEMKDGQIDRRDWRRKQCVLWSILPAWREHMSRCKQRSASNDTSAPCSMPADTLDTSHTQKAGESGSRFPAVLSNGLEMTSSAWRQGQRRLQFKDGILV